MIAHAHPQSLWPLIQRLNGIFSVQRREVVMRLPAALRTGQEISLAHWTRPMQDALSPLMRPYWNSGLVQGRREMQALLVGQPITPIKSHLLRAKRKDIRFVTGQDRMFSLFNPEVLSALDRATFQFCDETNATATRDLNEAIEALRGELKEGLQHGQAYVDLAKRIEELFADPYRSMTIAMTEVPRAMNGGALIAYEKAGAEGSVWMTTSRPCKKICEPLDGEERAFNQTFVVLTTGPAVYRQIFHPPAHPRCLCVSAPAIVL